MVDVQDPSEPHTAPHPGRRKGRPSGSRWPALAGGALFLLALLVVTVRVLAQLR